MFAAFLIITFCVFTGHSKSFSLKQETALRSENARLLRTNQALLKALKAMSSEKSVGGASGDYMCMSSSKCTENHICIDGGSGGDYCVGPVRENKTTIARRNRELFSSLVSNGQGKKSVVGPWGPPTLKPTTSMEKYKCAKHDDCVDICAKGTVGGTHGNYCVGPPSYNMKFINAWHNFVPNYEEGYDESDEDDFAEGAVGSAPEDPEDHMCSKHDDCPDDFVCATGASDGDFCVGPVRMNKDAWEHFQRYGY